MTQVLYRKYRPQTFDEVHGQDRIVEVLKQSTKKGDVAHAYLFSGGRGLGKTSIARIFARELGCDSVDIFEMDAASHTSVEDIRALKDAVYALPLCSEKKVYILDEVHMLSKAAFNAFLKTLEEPPSHVVFILATTESAYIPDTIKSRCQVCLFEKPSLDVLMNLVQSVAKKEKRSLEKESTELIALISDGSFRDALTLLQNVVTTSNEEKVSKEEVEKILGASSQVCVLNFISALLERDAEKGLDILRDLSKKGYDASLFGKRIVNVVRHALVCKFNKKDATKEMMQSVIFHPHLSLDFFKEVLDAAVQPAYVPYLPLEMLLFAQLEKDTPA